MREGFWEGGRKTGTKEGDGVGGGLKGRGDRKKGGRNLTSNSMLSPRFSHTLAVQEWK